MIFPQMVTVVERQFQEVERRLNLTTASFSFPVVITFLVIRLLSYRLPYRASAFLLTHSQDRTEDDEGKYDRKREWK